ncbi:MAG: hypothetical protein LQ351_005964 [Letrouitia transgressa]|nr:MAG: hypothetical protein LQ351_005964 [Letrouitia transgressa]
MAETSQYQATQKGGPFALVKVPKPTPGPGEVAIRLRMIDLNPVDWKKLHFGIMVESWPTVLGADGAGVVEAVGEGVSKFKTGDEVMTLCGPEPRSAGYQEVVCVAEKSVARKPTNLSLEEAATLPICFFTSAAAVYHGLGIPLPFLPGGDSTGFEPKSVLVLGGSSAVGAGVVQILRLSLPSATILTTSSSKHHARLSSLGATKAFDQRSGSLVPDIISATPGGKGVDAIIDTVGSAAEQKDIFETLRPDGPKEYAEVATGAQMQVPEGVKRQLTGGRMLFGLPGGLNAMPTLAELVEEGRFRVPTQVKKVGSGFEAIPKGLEELKAGVSGTKLVVAI